MKFQSHIPKSLLLSRLKLLSVGLFTALTCLFINPIIAHADPVDDIVAMYNGTHSDNRGGTSAIQNGVAYTRTGYLCYLLTKDGSPTGLPAYAFQSPGYNGIAGSKWVCTSRRGQSVSGWTAVAPWGVTPWENGGSPSNEVKIRDWMLQPINGKPQAQQFVFKTWGVEAEKNFQSDNYILVLETIMNFQYSKKGGSSPVSSGNGVIDSTNRSAIISTCYVYAIKYVNDLPSIPLSEIMKSTGAKTKSELIDILAEAAAERILAQLASQGSGRTFTSDPLIGTVPNLITYKNGNTVFDSYTNKVAPHSEKIKVNEAGFTAYTGTGSGPLSDSEVQSYGVAMLIIHSITVYFNRLKRIIFELKYPPQKFFQKALSK